MEETTGTRLPSAPMTVDEYLAWVQLNPGRFELYDGRVYAMAPERAVHAAAKFAAQTELVRAIAAAGVPCEMLPDGMTVRVSKSTAHEPDALVYCGPKVSDDAVEIPNPVIVVEVLSPSTRHIDATMKLAGYFAVSSVEHYMIVNPKTPLLILHSRQAGGTILTRLMDGGLLRLDPPGIEIDVSKLFPASPASVTESPGERT